MWIIGIIAVIDYPLLVWFVWMIYERSGLIFAIFFWVSTIPQIYIAFVWIRWMLNDSAVNANSCATWMLINLPSKFVHVIVQMIIAVLDDSEVIESQWNYYLLPMVADLTVFGYFFLVTYQYSKHKQDQATGVIMK